METSNPRITFQQSESTCGLVFESAERSDAGSWKCHLANTDKNESIRAEGFVDVAVATRAEVHFEHDIDDAAVILGDVINLSCSLVDPDVYPVPELTLFRNVNGTEDPEILTEGADMIQVSLSMQDEYQGSSFYCQSLQSNEDSSLYHVDFSENSPEIEIVFPPTIDDFLANHPPIIVTDSTLEIAFVFSSRPAPEDSDLSWTILNEDGEVIVAELLVGSNILSIRPWQGFCSYVVFLSMF